MVGAEQSLGAWEVGGLPSCRRSQPAGELMGVAEGQEVGGEGWSEGRKGRGPRVRGGPGGLICLSSHARQTVGQVVADACPCVRVSGCGVCARVRQGCLHSHVCVCHDRMRGVCVLGWMVCASVCVWGVDGVGTYVARMFARAGAAGCTHSCVEGWGVCMHTHVVGWVEEGGLRGPWSHFCG